MIVTSRGIFGGDFLCRDIGERTCAIMEAMKTNPAVLFVVGVLVGGILGFYVGDRAGRAALKPVLDVAYPPPAKDMKAFTGKVASVSSGGFVLEIPDPDDYLPHPDRSARRTELRTVLVTPETKVVYAGPAGEQAVSAANIAEGHRVRVESASNVRSARTFTASVVRVLSEAGVSGSVASGEQGPKSALPPEMLQELFRSAAPAQDR